MNNLLRSDAYHMYRKKWIWLCVAAMVLITIAFCVMQYTAMDYSVTVDRVIFLSMTFFGIAVAALISIYAGEDYSDGVIKNKIISGHSRRTIYLSKYIVGLTACVVVYLFTLMVSIPIGVHYFEVNVTTGEIIKFVILGVFTCLAYGSIYFMITMITGNKSVAVAICMALAFAMLFLSLNINSSLVQEEYKDGILNPHYVGGAKRLLYEFLFDLNPTGQVAQLSQMKCLSPIRFVLVDLLWVLLSCVTGVFFFKKKDI